MTLDEYQASRNQWFETMDKDRNKSVTTEEVEAMIAERKAKAAK